MGHSQHVTCEIVLPGGRSWPIDILLVMCVLSLAIHLLSHLLFQFKIVGLHSMVEQWVLKTIIKPSQFGTGESSSPRPTPISISCQVCKSTSLRLCCVCTLGSKGSGQAVSPICSSLTAWVQMQTLVTSIACLCPWLHHARPDTVEPICLQCCPQCHSYNY